jgi:hypothetical protein
MKNENDSGIEETETNWSDNPQFAIDNPQSIRTERVNRQSKIVNLSDNRKFIRQSAGNFAEPATDRVNYNPLQPNPTNYRSIQPRGTGGNVHR